MGWIENLMSSLNKKNLLSTQTLIHEKKPLIILLIFAILSFATALYLTIKPLNTGTWGLLIIAAILLLVFFIAKSRLHQTEKFESIKKDLSYQEGLARFYLNVSNSIILILDKTGTITFANNKACNVFCCDYNEIIGKEWFNAFIAENMKENEKLLFNKIMSGSITTPRSVKSEVKSKDKSLIILWNYTILKDKEGKIDGLLCSGEDTTELNDLKKLRMEYVVLTNAAEGISRLDSRGNYEYSNKVFSDLIGYSHNEIIGMDWRKIVHQDDIRKAMKAYIKMFKAGKATVEVRYIRKSGAICYSEVVLVKNSGTKGGFIGNYCFVKNISERKEIESALIESENRFRAVTQTATEAIIVAGREGKIISWNNGASNMFGYSEEEIIGKPLTIIMPEKYKNAHDETFRKLIETKKATILGRVVAVSGLRKDGSEFPVEICVNTWESNKNRFFAGIIRDITEREQAKKELLRTGQELEQFSLCLRKLHHLNITEHTSLEHLYQDYLDTGREIFGVPNVILCTVQGDKVYLNYYRGTDDHLERGMQLNDSLCSSPLLLKKMAISTCSSGQEILIGIMNTRSFDIEMGRFISTPIFNNGVACGILIFYSSNPNVHINFSGYQKELIELMSQSIGKFICQKQIEFEKQKALDELNARAKELECLNKHLQETQLQLIQSEKMASIGQLSAGIAHEINNPIGFIKCNLNHLKQYNSLLQKSINVNNTRNNNYDNLESTVTSSEQQKVINFLNDFDNILNESLDGTERIIEIVNGLKIFTRTSNLQKEETNINEMLKSVLNLLKNELKYKCEVKVNYGEIPLITCYQSQITQVFVNILLNSIQSIDKRGIITIETAYVNNQIEIRFCDTGIGIPRDNIPKLFTPFFTTKPVGKGTGLGLFISYNIIAKHDGKIDVNSQIGKGTIFTVYIPVNNKVGLNAN
ncbi:MAG: PAS domain S-box protein [Planctomycetes bacterium]|nr:PAS domain S-box protein [Planctomycetota bacterium]